MITSVMVSTDSGSRIYHTTRDIEGVQAQYAGRQWPAERLAAISRPIAAAAPLEPAALFDTIDYTIEWCDDDEPECPGHDSEMFPEESSWSGGHPRTVYCDGSCLRRR